MIEFKNLTALQHASSQIQEQVRNEGKLPAMNTILMQICNRFCVRIQKAINLPVSLRG